MQSVVEIFKERFFDAIDNHPDPDKRGTKFFTNLGQSRTNYYSLKKGETLPNSYNLALYCKALNSHPDYLLGFDGQLSIGRTSPPTSEIQKRAEGVIQNLFSIASEQLSGPLEIKTILNWWRANEGRLQDMGQIRPHVDIFKRPSEQDRYLCPVEMGRESLASKSLRTCSPVSLRHFMDTLTDKMRETIVFSYYQVGSYDPAHKALIEDHTITVDVKEVGEAFDLHYWKLMLPVRDAMGHEYILNYSTPVN